MSRKPRIISESGMYHIIFRGINKQNIFKEEQDYKKLKGIIKDVKLQMGFVIYAYCFMTNHVHILVRENNPGDISLIMKKILTRYAMWYNRKYLRSGSLFENRYKGNAIDDESYFYEVVRYIHNNPIRAGITRNRRDYPYSSYSEYFEEIPEVVEKNFVLSMINIDEFDNFHNKEDEIILKSNKMSDYELCNYIYARYGINVGSIKNLEKMQRKEILSQLRGVSSARQLERVTGISRKTIAKL